jgi:IPT/TIG domain
MTTIATVAPITAGWKWIAVLIGLGVLVLLWVVTSVMGKTWNPWKLVEGADGVSSTSKFQWLLWLVVILFAYVVLWVLRAKGGDYGAISQVPVNVLTVLGFSTATAVAAKGITAGYVSTNRIAKATGSAPAPAAATAPGGQGGILQDDGGIPELAKIQLIGFTLVAAGIFSATLIHQIFANPPQTALPNIDSSLLVLMGLSQGGYLGKKLVTFGSPMLSAIVPPSGAPNSSVTIMGASFGTTQGGSQLLLDDAPIPAVTKWSDGAVTFMVPAAYPVGPAPWLPNQQVALSVVVNGQTSNSLPFAVT